MRGALRGVPNYSFRGTIGAAKAVREWLEPPNVANGASKRPF